MRKIGSFLGLVLVCCVAIFCQAQRMANNNEIIALDWGARNSTTLNQLIAALPATEKTIIISGGEWAISNNVTWPATANVRVLADSSFNIDNGIVMTFSGGEFNAGHWTCFSGLGTATGTGRFLWRVTEWGSTTSYNIGPGDIQPYVDAGDTAVSNYVLNYMESNYVKRTLTSFTTNVSSAMTSTEIQSVIDDVGRWMDNGVNATIQFADGSYFMSNSLTLKAAPAGRGQLRLIGNTSNPNLVSLLINTNTAVSGIDVEAGAGDHYIDGIRIAGWSTNIANGVAGFLAQPGAYMNLGSNCAATTCEKGFGAAEGATLFARGGYATTCYYGFIASRGGMVDAQDGEAYDCARGFYAQHNATVWAQDAYAHDGLYGFFAANGSHIAADSAIAMNNTNEGFYANTGSTISAPNSTSETNRYSFAASQMSYIDAAGASTNGNDFSYTSPTNGTIGSDNSYIRWN